MGLPNVRILLQNGQLGGLLRLADGVAGMIGTGVAVADKIGVGDPRYLTSLQDAIAIGIDTINNPVAYRHVREFYEEAGEGAELYIMLVPDTMTQTVIMDSAEEDGAVKLLNYAEGRIRILTSFFTPDEDYVLDDTNGIDDDVFTAVIKAQALGNAYALNQMPLRIILEGRAFNDDATTLPDITTMTENRVAIAIGSSLADGTASVGMVLGRLARIPVQRKISRVKDGRLAITVGYVGTESVNTFSGLTMMHDKGFIVMRGFPGLAGAYFSDDHTATKPTDDYAFLARGRIIDKAQIIAYATYIEELHDEILIDEAGKIDIGVIRFLEQKIENQINQLMTANSEISGVTAFIDPDQNVLASNKTTVILKVRPVGYNSDIEVKLGFDNPNS
jgi:hypothetical protein